MLGQRVPPYMMPAEIVLIAELPWLANFKIDRKRLAELDAGRGAARAAEHSPLIEELIDIFQRVTRVAGEAVGAAEEDRTAGRGPGGVVGGQRTELAGQDAVGARFVGDEVVGAAA